MKNATATSQGSNALLLSDAGRAVMVLADVGDIGLNGSPVSMMPDVYAFRVWAATNDKGGR